jgi:nitroreductase
LTTPIATHAPDPATLLEARYQDGSGPKPTQWNEVLATLLSHHSVRRYLPDALPNGTLELLIAAAQSAASSSNLQTWSVVAVEDPARKATFARLAGNQKHIAQCPLFLIWLADLDRIAELGRTHQAQVEALQYFDLFLVAILDAALAAQNAVTAAESLGLGSVYIGGIRNHIEAVAEELKLPPNVTPAFGLCIGYPDRTEIASIKPRLPQAAVLHRETYSRTAQDAPVAAYSDTLKAYFKSQGMETGGWIGTALKRVRDIGSLHGREGLRDSLAKFGFELR